jgi:type IV pilus assembly protein PilM
MATPKAAWGIEIGAHAIKAIRLEREGDRVAVTDFAVIPHKRVLSTPDLDQDEMVRLGLGQFISQKTLEGEHLVLSVPGHVAFARFAKLPPVEPKKVPDIVKFEAVQQIPFPIDQVEWDYQTFASDDSSELQVGIFAITRDRVQHRLSLYSELGLTPESLTLSPVAVYNAMAFDHDLVRQGPVIFLDIGTNATDVIIADNERCWIRTFPLGGTHFTEAIASAFKLGYTKAERLKQEAATSKYAKQIMQAMRPVFSDLLQDLQRSIGYYSTLRREGTLRTMVGVGSTFKIPGLRKFLGQQLQMNVVRLDEYKKITVRGREAASFAENAVNMATAYGLALQGVDLGQINANLMPLKILRDQMWHAKTKWFAAAAAIIVLGAGMTLYRPLSDRAAMHRGGLPPVVEEVLSVGGELKRQFEQVKESANVGYQAQNIRGLLEYRDVWPYLVNDAAESLASTDPQSELLGDNVLAILAMPPGERRLVQLTHLDGQYVPPEGKPASRRITVRMDVELSHEKPIDFLNDTVAKWLRDNAERPGVPYRIINPRLNPALLTTVEVTEEGEVANEPSGGAAPESRRPGVPSMGGPGSQPGGTGAPERGGGGVGRRQRSSDQPKRAPGAGADPFGRGAPQAPSGPPRRTPPQRPGAGDRPGGPAGPRGVSHQALDALAPVRDRPRLYPPGSQYYRLPITFEVEILDPGAVARGIAEEAAS